MILAGTSKVFFITQPLRWLLVHIHTATGASWAWSIVLLTVLVRLVLVPLTVKQQQSMRAMQNVQPEIKKLQAKYKHDRQKLNQEMMAFYKENRVNPFGSCLPIVVQIPVFIGLYSVLRSPGTFIHPGDDVTFLLGFLHDITTHLNKLPTLQLAILMIVYVGSQVGSAILMPSSVDKNQKYLFMAMPIVFAFVIVNQAFPVGLMLYWITTNLWTVGQAAMIRKYYPPPTVSASGPAPPTPKGPKLTKTPPAKPAPARPKGPAPKPGGAKAARPNPRGEARTGRGQGRRRGR